MKLKGKIHHLLNENRLFMVFIQGLIMLNVLAVMLESVAYMRDNFGRYFNWFEIVSVLTFTIEYLLRIWSADFGTGKPVRARLLFFFSFLGLIDLFAILPFYLPFIIKADLRFLRILRLIRTLLIVKVARYSKALRLIVDVFKKKKEELVLTLFVAFLLLLVASSLMFYVEHKAQPEQFTNMFQSLWWAVATLTTIGYGDIYPVTAIGKILGGVIAILGIGFVALPTAILSTGFIDALREKTTIHTCPHCGKEIKEMMNDE